MNAYDRLIEWLIKSLTSDESKSLVDMRDEVAKLGEAVFCDREKILSDEEWLKVPKSVRLNCLGSFFLQLHKSICSDITRRLVESIFGGKSEDKK